MTHWVMLPLLMFRSSMRVVPAFLSDHSADKFPEDRAPLTATISLFLSEMAARLSSIKCRRFLSRNLPKSRHFFFYFVASLRELWCLPADVDCFLYDVPEADALFIISSSTFNLVLFPFFGKNERFKSARPEIHPLVRPTSLFFPRPDAFLLESGQRFLLLNSVWVSCSLPKDRVYAFWLPLPLFRLC